MALPPLLVAGFFLIAAAAAIAWIVYTTWRGSKPSDFFAESVKSTYDLQLSDSDINAYYDLKEKVQAKYAPESLEEPAEEAINEDGTPKVANPWALKVPQEERMVLQQALMRRLVGCIDKLDQVQRDKPGNWKLWRGKLVSEHFWNSIVDAEKFVREEIDSCVAEAEELAPGSGWRDHIFPEAVQCWRMQKHRDMEKKVQKKAVKDVKKEAVKEVRKKVVDAKKEIEDKERQEKAAEKAMAKLLAEMEREDAKDAKSKKAAPKSGGKAAAPKSGSKKK